MISIFFFQISVSSCAVSSLEPVPEASFQMADFPLLKPDVLNAICKLSGMVSMEKNAAQVEKLVFVKTCRTLGELSL